LRKTGAVGAIQTMFIHGDELSDREVAAMVARYAGASLGLLAFAITTTAGLLANNPVDVTLSRSIQSLFVFFGIGTVLGMVTQRVIAEHEKSREDKIRERYHEERVNTDVDTPLSTQAEVAGSTPVTTGAVGAQ
jgi:hypothetical protein